MDGGIERVDNPMHSAAVSQLREDNAELRGENARLKERLRQHGTLEDGDDTKEDTAIMSIPQQDALEAGEANTTPSTDEATSRLAGFGKISGEIKSLERKTNQTSRATAEKETVEVSVDEL